MKFFTDAISVIGTSHVRSGTLNQDYACANVKDHYGYIVVSDGCSRGARTDIGARIQSLAVATAIEQGVHMCDLSVSDIMRTSMATVKDAMKLFHLTNEDLLATSLYSVITPQYGHIVVQGDGAIAIGYRDGSWKFIRIEWGDNMPFYPIYTHMDQSESFVRAHGGYDAERVMLECVCVDKQGEMTHWCERKTLRKGMEGVAMKLSQQDVKDIVAVGLFSDGVVDINNVHGAGVFWGDVLQKLMAFKNVSGVFFVRRMMRVLRDFAKDGYMPQDDMSGAVLVIDHENTEAEDECG